MFTFDTHAPGRRIKGNAMSKPTQNVKHHVNVVDGQSATKLGSTRFFGEHVKVESNAIPCEDCEAALRFTGQVFHQFRKLVLFHLSRGARSALSSVPNHRRVLALQESSRTANPKRAM
jgi:hypothetical protein